MTADPETRLRADARRNRDLILAAATAKFAAAGVEVPMDEIARAAGVGVGTLYRRFPDRETLIREVARDNFRRGKDEAHAAADAEPTAWQALVRILEQAAGLKLSTQLLLLSPMARAVLREDELTAGLRSELLEVLDGVVQAAQAEGSLRKDVGTGDMVIMLGRLLREPPGATTSDHVARTSSDRWMTLLLDAFHTGQSRLPGRPLTVEDLDASTTPSTVAARGQARGAADAGRDQSARPAGGMA